MTRPDGRHPSTEEDGETMTTDDRGTTPDSGPVADKDDLQRAVEERVAAVEEAAGTDPVVNAAPAKKAAKRKAPRREEDGREEGRCSGAARGSARRREPPRRGSGRGDDGHAGRRAG